MFLVMAVGLIMCMCSGDGPSDSKGPSIARAVAECLGKIFLSFLVSYHPS